MCLLSRDNGCGKITLDIWAIRHESCQRQNTISDRICEMMFSEKAILYK